MADLKREHDHLAVTGDLANISLPQEFAPARLAGIAGLTADVRLVLGNHDAYVLGQGLSFATREWDAYMSDDEGGVRFPYLRRRGQTALIGLFIAVPTAVGLATGRLGSAQIRGAFGEMLDALQAKEKLFRVVMIHHPPVSKAHSHKLLRDADALKRVIAAHGVELLLHGHDHLHMLNWLAGPDGSRVPAVGVPSASAAPGRARNAAAYNLYLIDGAPGAWTCAMTSRGIGAAGTVMQQRRIKLLG